MAVRHARDTSARFVSQLRGWVLDRALGDVHDALRQVNRRVTKLEVRMGAVTDALRAFRAQVDTETSRLSEQLASMQARLDAGDAGAAAEVSAELGPVLDTLRAMGTGGQADPLPDPETDVDLDDEGA